MRYIGIVGIVMLMIRLGRCYNNTININKFFMFKIHSVTGRMFIGIIIGLAYSLLIMVVAPFFNISLTNIFGLGGVMLFVMMGFTIGLVGIFDTHPIFKIRMRWWLRGVVAGTIFGLIYVFIGYESMNTILQTSALVKFGFASPFWALTDFIFAGLIMAFFETKIAGQGSKLPLK